MNAIRIGVLSIVACLLLGGLGACSGRYDLCVAMDVYTRSHQPRPAARRHTFARQHESPGNDEARPRPARPPRPPDTLDPTADLPATPPLPARPFASRSPAPEAPGDPLRRPAPAAFSDSPPVLARSDARSRRSQSPPIFDPAPIPYPPAPRNNPGRAQPGFSTLLQKVAAAASTDQPAGQQTLSPSRIFSPPPAARVRPLRPPSTFPSRSSSPSAAPKPAASLMTDRPTAAPIRVAPPARESTDRNDSDRRNDKR